LDGTGKKRLLLLQASFNIYFMQRRVFLKSCAGFVLVPGILAGITSPAAIAEGASGRRPSIRLGGPIFAKTEDPEELAQAHRQLGYRAAYCPNVELTNTDRIRALSQAFARREVVLAEVGRWCNLLDPDAAQRRKNLDQVIEGLALAEAVGALCCVDIAGSYNPKVWYGPHPKNLSREFFDAAVENARRIIDGVKPSRAKFCYEMMGWSLPDSADCYRKMIKAVDRRPFGVHLDPCNLVNSPDRFYQNSQLIRDCVEKLGPHIVSCHAKDLSWEVEMNVHFREVRPGTGAVDYATYLGLLARLPQRPPLMLEHLPNAEEYDLARRFILDKCQQEGIQV
jgi:sugar phosphate isomerase/epimerase